MVPISHEANAHGGVDARVFRSVLFRAEQAMLVMGDPRNPVTPVRRAMVVWHPEPRAVRALRCSLPLLGDVEQVHVVLVNREERETGDQPGADAARYLERHGPPVKVDTITGVYEVANALVEHADKIDTDIVVLGAYGRSRLREWMLGGTTRFMVSSMKRPLLMAH